MNRIFLFFLLATYFSSNTVQAFCTSLKARERMSHYQTGGWIPGNCFRPGEKVVKLNLLEKMTPIADSISSTYDNYRPKVNLGIPLECPRVQVISNPIVFNLKEATRVFKMDDSTMFDFYFTDGKLLNSSELELAGEKGKVICKATFSLDRKYKKSTWNYVPPKSGSEFGGSGQCILCGNDQLDTPFQKQYFINNFISIDLGQNHTFEFGCAAPNSEDKPSMGDLIKLSRINGKPLVAKILTNSPALAEGKYELPGVVLPGNPKDYGTDKSCK